MNQLRSDCGPRNFVMVINVFEITTEPVCVSWCQLFSWQPLPGETGLVVKYFDAQGLLRSLAHPLWIQCCR